MLRLILISALVVLLVARKDRSKVPRLDGRIVGGSDTTIEEFPYQVSLQSRGSHICGASIIGSNKVLTAAHCTDGVSASTLSVRVGSTNRGSGGTVVQVASICQHPQYNSTRIDNDVSVLRLSTSLNTTNAIQQIDLAALGSSVSVGTYAIVTGWGTTSEGGSLPTILKKVEVPKISQQNCKSAYGSSAITDSMTCYGYTQGGKDACQGDSGGPLAISGTLFGVTSWGIGCARGGKPGVYADVTKPIIQNHINSC